MKAWARWGDGRLGCEIMLHADDSRHIAGRRGLRARAAAPEESIHLGCCGVGASRQRTMPARPCVTTSFVVSGTPPSSAYSENLRSAALEARRAMDLPALPVEPLETIGQEVELAELAPGLTPAFTSDSILVQLAAAEAGLGAAVLPRLRHPSPGRPGSFPSPRTWARGRGASSIWPRPVRGSISRGCGSSPISSRPCSGGLSVRT